LTKPSLFDRKEGVNPLFLLSPLAGSNGLRGYFQSSYPFVGLMRSKQERSSWGMLSMGGIKIAICGLGNCASSLIQGIEYYRRKNEKEAIGLMHWDLGSYKPHDIEVVAAFDIDRRKVGKDVSDAIFELPNCTKVFCRDIKKTGVKVRMGRVLDSFAGHMKDYDKKYAFVLSDKKEATKKDVVKELKSSGAEILLNYLPVGSGKAVEFYAECALEAGVGLLNNIPVFIASNPKWRKRFEKANIPLIGDDIKSQLGATIVHRVLTNLFENRGVKLERTYQLNTGGNTDFLNMLDRTRLTDKKKSKTDSVRSQSKHPLTDENIHIGPSDWVAWQKDNKVCFLRMEGRIFGDIPMNLELRLSVEDSPNSAGVSIDAIRCLKLALDRGKGGILYSPSAYFMKHPPKQYTDDEAYWLTEDFIKGKRDD
jgi:myo-inositol-1-phosphate synthase